MKNMTKRMISLVMVMTMMASAVMAVDNGSTITYRSKDNWDYSLDIDYAMTDTDLFDNYKNIMPGDVLSEKVTIKNECGSCDYIVVYMDAELHNEDNKPVVDNTIDLDKMNRFLDYLTLTVTNTVDGSTVFTGKANSLTIGFEGDPVRLGELRNGRSLDLNVTLNVDINMANEFANYMGEVDWVFFVEEGYDPDDPDPTTKPTTWPTEPTTGPTNPTEPTEPTIDIDDPNVPLDPVDPDNPSSPDTGDHSNMLPYIVLFIVGLMGLILTSKKRKTN